MLVAPPSPSEKTSAVAAVKPPATSSTSTASTAPSPPSLTSRRRLRASTKAAATTAEAKPAPSAKPRLLRLLPRLFTLWRPGTDWRAAMGETIVLMTLLLAVSYWLRPLDPFWIGTGFPWVWLGGVLLALRYGSAAGVAAMAVALAAWFGFETYGALHGTAFPRVAFLGGLVLALIAGEFSDVWNSRLNQAQAVNAYLDERLQALTHNHFLLSVSHEKLEQELISQPFTLREMLSTLRDLLARELPRVQAKGAAAQAVPAADWLLQLLTQTCRLEAAALFAYDGKKLMHPPVAAVGNFEALLPDDPMLRAALESGQLMHLQTDPFVDSEAPSRYVVCAPAMSSSGRLLGMLVVSRIAFTALNLETLQLATVLLSYYADSVDSASSTGPVLQALPQCSPDFALELVRLRRLLTDAAVRSSMVVLAGSNETDSTARECLAQVARQRRSTDAIWETTRNGRRLLLILLPLTVSSGVDGFLERIATNLREQLGTDLARAGISVHTAEVNEEEPADQIMGMLEHQHG